MQKNPTLFHKKPLAMAISSVLSGMIISPAALAMPEPCSPVGTTYMVTSTANDTSPGTLLTAIADANTNIGCDQISFASNVTAIDLNTASVTQITDDVNIVGNGINNTSLSNTNSLGRVLDIGTADAYIADMSISNSSRSIVQLGGSLDLQNLLISGNSVNGISASNTETTADNIEIRDINGSALAGFEFSSNNTQNVGLSITNSRFINNTNSSTSGGLSVFVGNNASDIVLRNNVFSGNGNTNIIGGALQIVHAAFGSQALNATLENNTFSGNIADSGSAIYIDSNGSSGTLNLLMRQNTISGNQGMGAAIHLDNMASGPTAITNIESTTVVNNSAMLNTPGIFVGTNHTVNLLHSVVALNTSTNTSIALNINGTIANANYSWIAEERLPFFAPTITNNISSVIDGDDSTLKLGDLADNGGSTETHLPAADSPLVNTGDSMISEGSTAGTIFANDQRGSSRVVGSAIDIGAVEYTDAVNSSNDSASSNSSSNSSSGSIGLLGLFSLLSLSLLRVRRKA